MSKYTQGPWSCFGQVVEVKSGAVFICHCPKDREGYILGIPRSEAENNARLIAKAPELVEALRAMCDRYPEPPGYSTIAGRQARALLAEIDDTQAEQETAVYDRYFQP